MPAPGKAVGALAKQAAKVAGPKAAELAKKGAKHTAVDKALQESADKAAEKVIAAAIGFATGGAGAAVGRQRAKRPDRRYARDLARQIGGTYSLNVIIGQGRYHVVWNGQDVPYRVVPELPEGTDALEDLPDLRHFRGERLNPAKTLLSKGKGKAGPALPTPAKR